jgi:hypothetical protein
MRVSSIAHISSKLSLQLITNKQLNFSKCNFLKTQPIKSKKKRLRDQIHLINKRKKNKSIHYHPKEFLSPLLNKILFHLIETVNSQKAKLVFLKMDNNVPST